MDVKTGIDRADAIARDYAEGVSAKEISAKYKVSTGKICEIMRERGMRLRGRGAKPKWPILYPAVAERMAQDGLNYVELAEKAGYTARQMAHALTGRKPLTRRLAKRVGEALCVNYVDLFGDIEDPRDTEASAEPVKKGGTHEHSGADRPGKGRNCAAEQANGRVPG